VTGEVRHTLSTLHSSGALDLPHPGSGSTAKRLRGLWSLSRLHPVGVARLAEAHTDAMSILFESGRRPVPGALYGVWASQSSTKAVVFDRSAARLDGTMDFASGCGIVDRALVTARTRSGTVLIDVDVSLAQTTIEVDSSAWSTPALADTATGPITFDAHAARPVDVLGAPGWYLQRPGFWHGACGPAACWAGGASGLIESAADFVDDDPHKQAHHGALTAHDWTLTALLDDAGRQIDADPGDAPGCERLARSLRFAVAGICHDVIGRFGRAFGPRPHVGNARVAQRVIDLDLYVKQHHAERELPRLSQIVGWSQA